MESNGRALRNTFFHATVDGEVSRVTLLSETHRLTHYLFRFIGFVDFGSSLAASSEAEVELSSP